MSEREVGLVPGTPVLHDEDAQPTTIRLFDFQGDALIEQAPATVEDAAARLGADSVTWVDLVGLKDVARVTRLADAFGVHPLYVESIVDTESRPKLMSQGEMLFLVLKMVHPDGRAAEQVSLVFGTDFVLTFQEQEGDAFQAVRERLRSGRGRIRQRGADYLTFALIDAVVDGLLAVAEEVEDQVEELEKVLLEDPPEDVPRKIYALKQQLRFLHRLARPQRDAVAALIRVESDLIDPKTTVFLRDVQDQLDRVEYVLSSARESAAALMELYLSMGSHRMNESMHVLTVLTAMFAPPTFVAGLYGMNFVWMPELRWSWGYPVAVALMLSSSAAMYLVLWRKGWV